MSDIPLRVAAEAADHPAALRDLLPLWRYGVFLVCLAAAATVAVGVRMDVQGARLDLERTARLQADAELLHERLLLEREARHRSVALEGRAADAGLGDRALLVSVTSR